MKKPILVIIGALPPPNHGPTISTRRLLDSDIHKEFIIEHLDISDHRNLDNIGKIDWQNVFLALKQTVQLVWICLKFRPRVTYVATISGNISFARDGLFILTAKIFSNASVVVHLRSGLFFEQYKKFSYLTRKFMDVVLHSTDRAIVQGESLKSNFQKWFKESHIDVVPNGTPAPKNLPIPKLNKEKADLKIVFMSRLAEVKGIVDLVSAIHSITTNYPNVTFNFAGSWWDKDQAEKKCEAIIEEYSLQKHVRFLGVIDGDAKWQLLSEMDVFVLPTFWDEGHPNAIIEAMAASLPVISTPIAAIPDTVIEGVTGFLIPPHNPEKIAEKIKFLLDNPVDRHNMGLAARKRYEKFYTQEKNIGAMISVFKKSLL